MEPIATAQGSSDLRVLDLDSFDRALEAATWITKADLAAVNLARHLIDSLRAEFDTRNAKLLLDVLTSLGMTVAGRAGKPEPEQEVSPLDRIKQRSALRIANSQTPNATS